MLPQRLKGECVKEVKRLNGNFTFKDANDWQKGYYTKENDVEKEDETYNRRNMRERLAFSKGQCYNG